MKILKKTGLITLILLVVLAISSCSINKLYLSDVDNALPTKGPIQLKKYWEITKALKLGPKITPMDEDYLKGLRMSIETSRFTLGTDVILNPEIKVIKANSYEYFLINYKMTVHDAGIPSENIEVYTITDSKGFLVKLFKLNDDEVVVERNEMLLSFKSTVGPPEAGGATRAIPGSVGTKADSEANGVLLGLRSKRTVENGMLGPSKYRTVWISLNKEGQMEIYEVPEILFPRNVFYTLSVDREENIDIVNESVVIKNMNGQTVVKESIASGKVSRFSDVTFISNDYLSLETRLAENKEMGEFQYYSTKNVERNNLSVNSKLSDLFGVEGKNIFETAAKNAITVSGKSPSLLESINETSFILKRANGRWEYSGRVNSSIKSSDFVTFNMHLGDNLKLYRYDSLLPRWSEIKQKVPGAIDAVSSPEDYFTVVKTEKELIVYKKENGNLVGLPIAVIKLDPGETIIMNEWARASYVYDWSSLVKRLGKPIEVRN